MDCSRALLLESIHSVHLRAELDGRTLKRLLPFARRHDAIAGQYDVIGDVTWMVYRQDGKLTLRIGDASFVVDDAIAIAFVGGGNARKLRIARGEREVGVFDCPEPRPSFFTSTLGTTAFAEAEDSDLPLLVRNIAGDRGRRERAYSPPEAGT